MSIPMTIKQLKRYPYIKARIRRLPDEIDRLKGDWAVCGSIMASNRGEPYNMREIIIGERDTSTEAQYRILEKQSELEAAYCDLRDIENFIDDIDDARIKEIMTFRYIYGESWSEVAKHFGYHESVESVRKAVKRYLQNVNKLRPI